MLLHRQETAALNQHALAEKIRQLGLKQWWLADQIAVDKRTVNRWLTGKVRRISHDNLERLAILLKCSEDELIYADETDTRATQKEQNEASRMLLDPAAQLMFAVRNEYPLYESLLKAVMHPNMGIQQLCDIYAQLTIVAAGQGNAEQSRRYAELALQYAIRCGDIARELSARNNIIAADGETGQLPQARRQLEEMVSLTESIGQPRARAVAQINLMHCQRLLGEMPAAIRTARQCLTYFMARRRNLEFKDRGALIISAFFAANIARDIGNFKLARRLRLYYKSVDKFDHLPRTIHASAIFVADLDSLEGRHAEALQGLEAGIQAFRDLGRVQDAEVIHPSCIYRRAGKLEEARAWLDEMEARGALTVFDPPFMAEERARVEAAAGQFRAAETLRAEANELFTALGMTRRCTDNPALDTGQLFKPPSREKLAFED